MNDTTAASLRNVASRLGGLCMAVIVLCLIDGLTSQLRQEFNTFDLLAGEAMVINGPMPPETTQLSELIIEGATDVVRIRPEEIYKGFWMGGVMWKGEARAAESAAAGRYTVSVRAAGEEKPNPALTFTFKIFADASGKRANAAALVVRYVGFHPYAVAAGLLPLAILCGLTVFFLAKKMERDMAARGKAEIYMIKRSPEGLQISFGLGRDHGVEPGALVCVQNEAGLTVGRARVTGSTETDSTAVLTGDGQAELGNLVTHEHAAPREDAAAKD
jgi:hypothetical protein